ncbi:MAG: phosphatase PAP2 family protein, partial [Sphingobacteriales bacterium]
PVDGPVTGVGAAWSLYAFTRIYNKDTSTLAEIAALNKDDINGFDRWAAGMYDPDAAKTSDYLFYGSMPLPILLLIDKNIRKDAPAVGFLYLESMAITGLLYTGSTFLTNRYRPESYTTELPMAEKVDGGYRNSFFAGHVALVATSTFFCAKVYSDYHPDSKLKYALWGGAIAATGATAYLRHKAGKHFPTDIIVGTAVGTLSGILVPHLHKRKPGSEQAWMLSPTIGNGYGLAFTYNIR